MTWFHSRWAREQAVRLIAGLIAAGLAISGFVWAQPPRAELSVLCSNNVESCLAVAQEFELETGTTVHTVRLPTSEALGRIRVAADQPEFDVWLGGPAESYVDAANEGLLVPIGDLPSVRQLPESLRDTDGYWAGVYGGILAFCVNTDLLADADVPNSWEDLLGPQFQGGILMSSPLLSGTAATMLWVQYSRLGGTGEMVSYMRTLETNLQGYLDSGTAVARNVARGNASVGISFAPYCEAERVNGAPVKLVYPEDGTGFEVGAVAIVAGTRNHEGARDFVSFAVSAQGQRVSASQVPQSYTTPDLSPNLIEEINSLVVPVLGGDVSVSAQVRSHLITVWATEVRRGTY